MSRGAEIAAALHELARAYEAHPAMLDGRAEPFSWLSITVKVRGGFSKPSGSNDSGGRWGNTTPEERSAAASRAAAGRWGPKIDASVTHDLTHPDASTTQAIHEGGRGGSVPEQHGKEREIPGTDLKEQDPGLAPDASIDASVDASKPDASATKKRRQAPPVDGTPEERGAVMRVFEAWRQDTGHFKAVLDRKRGRRILARLREGFTPERLILAITHRRNDPWLMGQGNSPRVFDDFDQLLRDAAQVERLERLTSAPAPREPRRAGAPQPKQQNGTDPFEKAVQG